MGDDKQVCVIMGSDMMANLHSIIGWSLHLSCESWKIQTTSTTEKINIDV